MTDANLIADFIASKGVTVIAPEARTVSGREMYRAVRGETIADQRADAVETRRAARDVATVRCVTDHAGREFWMNEAGEWL